MWTDEVVGVNEWDEVNSKLYVDSGYWVDGYTDDSGELWSDIITPSNTWTQIG